MGPSFTVYVLTSLLEKTFVRTYLGWDSSIRLNLPDERFKIHIRDLVRPPPAPRQSKRG